jgi:cell division protein FtsN
VAASAAPKTPKAVPAGLRYVQVGTFGVPQNAQNSIARLAGMGMPVSSQRMDKNGKQLTMVLAGPFSTPEQTLHALAQARAAGYRDAFARK